MIKINRKEAENVNRFGIEIELNNIDPVIFEQAMELKGLSCQYEGYTHRVTNHWKLVTDSSIVRNRPTDQPHELVSPILNGVAGLQELRKVCECLLFVNASVNKSCGVHVHHEARDITDAQCNNLLNFYARCERTFDAFMPVSRKRENNPFCHSMISAYERMQSWETLSDLGKYHKLNFEKRNSYGTLEFRHHSGTTEWEKLYHWVCLTANFLHNCKNKTSRASMNFVERAWFPKHLKLSKRTWNFYKERMKKLDDMSRESQTGRVRLSA